MIWKILLIVAIFLILFFWNAIRAGSIIGRQQDEILEKERKRRVQKIN